MPTSRSIAHRTDFRLKLPRVVSDFYEAVFDDPLLEGLFRDKAQPHAERLSLYLDDAFFGGSRYETLRGGFETVVRQHEGLPIQRKHADRWVWLMMGAVERHFPRDSELCDFLAWYFRRGAEWVWAERRRQ